MADIYVATTGNDTTGTGLIGAPYATPLKALTVAAAGDNILVGAGTYALDSGSGYWNIASNFASYVNIYPLDGNPNSVIITGTSALQVAIFVASSYIRFHGIVFRSHADTVTQIVRFANANINNIIFDTCRFQIIGKSGQTNVAVASSWTSGTSTLHTVHFINCVVEQAGVHPVAGVLLDKTATGMSVYNFRFINPDIRIGDFAMRLMGLNDFLIQNPTLSSSAPTKSATCLQIGQDAATGVDTTGRIVGGSVAALIGHAAVIGGGCSNVEAIGVNFSGGYNASNGQGLVLKNCTGGRVARCTIFGGYLSGIYLKAAQNMLIEDNDIFNRFAASPALRVGINNEDNSKVANNVIRENRIHAEVGPLFSWDNSTGDDGGGVCDQNVYNVSGAGTWGSVRGTTIASLAALQAAWAGYDRPFNDTSSRTGRKSMRDRSALKAVL